MRIPIRFFLILSIFVTFLYILIDSQNVTKVTENEFLESEKVEENKTNLRPAVILLTAYRAGSTFVGELEFTIFDEKIFSNKNNNKNKQNFRKKSDKKNYFYTKIYWIL